jgi:hypothetical protein
VFDNTSLVPFTTPFTMDKSFKYKYQFYIDKAYNFIDIELWKDVLTPPSVDKTLINNGDIVFAEINKQQKK